MNFITRFFRRMRGRKEYEMKLLTAARLGRLDSEQREALEAMSLG